MIQYDIDKSVLDEVHKLTGIPKSDTYFHIWYWFYLRASDFTDLEFSWRESMEEQIKNFSNKKEQETLGKKYTEEFFSKEDFKWISKDERQLRLLSANASIILSRLAYVMPDETELKLRKEIAFMGTIENIEKSSIIKLYCDFWFKHTNFKKNVIDSFIDYWFFTKSRDKRFNWFLGNDSQEKRNELYEWMRKNIYSPQGWSKPFDTHVDILEFFDTAGMLDANIASIIEKIKRNIYQKRHRKNCISKTQKNFVLSNNTIARLNKIQEMYGISHTQIIETLIRKEVEKNIYISEEMFMLRSLNELNSN